MSIYRGWQVVIAGVGINFLVGITYAWSIYARGLSSELGWSQAQVALPYTVFVFCYAFSMAAAGRMQDLAGPRLTVTVGGILIGASFILSSLFLTPGAVSILWGLGFGIGLACCFGSVTPAAIKWFPANRRGLITGIVVTGVGLSALLLTPLIHILVERGIAKAFFYSGVSMLIGIVSLAQRLANPPESKNVSGLSKTGPWHQILQTPQFYLMWLMFCFTAVAGVTFTSHLDKIVRVHASFDKGYLMVILFALFNTAGRPVAGILSDALGRSRAMTVVFSVMALDMVFVLFANSPVLIGIATALLGMTYGGIYTLFPAAVASYFGQESFGLNYGLVFTALGVAGLFPLVAGYLYDLQGNYYLTFFFLFVFSLSAVVLSLLLKSPHTVADGSLQVKV
ncbi:MAG: L-lactate MFS transporter [Bacillota bacterium]